MRKPVFIGDILHRIRRPVCLDPKSRYKLVTVKLYHKGVVLREEKLGADIKSKMYQVKEGDFILSGIDARNGAFGIVPPELDGAIVTNDFWYFEIDEDVVDKAFFLEVTSTHWFDEICRKASDGTTQRIRLQKGKFFNQAIYLPDLEEQRSFNKRFQAIKLGSKALSSELTHQQALLKKLRQQILQEAVEGKLTADWRAQNPDVEPVSELLKRIAAEKAQLVKDKKIKAQKPLPPITDEEKPFELPQGWEWCRLGDIAEAQDPNPSHRMPAKEINGVPFISPVNVSKSGDINFATGKKVAHSVLEDQKARYTVQPHSFAFSRIGTIGDVFKLPLPHNYCLSYSLSVITPVLPLMEDFMMKLVSSNVILKQAIHGTTKNTIPDLGMQTIRSFVMPIPSLIEQSIIVMKIEKLFALCDQLETQITQNQSHAEQLMQAVLKEAFSHNGEAEPATKTGKAGADNPVAADA